MIDDTKLNHNMGRHTDSPVLACPDCCRYWATVFGRLIVAGACLGGLLAYLA